LRRKLLIAIPLLLLLFGFQNCMLDSSHTIEGGSSFIVKDACSSSLEEAFQNTYYPVFRSQCVDCHDTGAGFGHFANSDFSVAFSEFESLGRSTIEHNFVNPSHQPPHT